MKVLIILSLLAVSISAFPTSEEVCEWASNASEDEKNLVSYFALPLIGGVLESHGEEIKAAAAADANLQALIAALEDALKGQNFCDGWQAGEAAFGQLSADSQALFVTLLNEIDATAAAVEASFRSKRSDDSDFPTSDEVCEWASNASDDEKNFVSVFFLTLIEAVGANYDFEAAAAADANLAAYGAAVESELKGQNFCDGAKAAEATFGQLTADSQALVISFWTDVFGAAAKIEEAFITQ